MNLDERSFRFYCRKQEQQCRLRREKGRPCPHRSPSSVTIPRAHSAHPLRSGVQCTRCRRGEPDRRDSRSSAVADLLRALGRDPREPAPGRHPAPGRRRLHRAADAARVRHDDLPQRRGLRELVLVRDIPFHSLCEHHLLPFRGVAHIGYLPGERLLGLSKLARVLELLRPRPPGAGAADQAGRRLAAGPSSEPRGVGVVLEAEHLCMSIRGVQGRRHAHHHDRLPRRALRSDREARSEFLAACGRHGYAAGVGMTMRRIRRPDIRHRRRRPRRRAAPRRRSATRASTARMTHRRGRRRTPVHPPAALQGVPVSGKAERDEHLRAPGRLVRRARRRACSAGTARRAHRPGRPRAARSTASEVCATTSCCSRPAPRPRRCPGARRRPAGVHYLRTVDDSRARSRQALAAAAGRRPRRLRLDRAGGGRRRPRLRQRASPCSAGRPCRCGALGDELGAVFGELHRAQRRRPPACRPTSIGIEGGAAG